MLLDTSHDWSTFDFDKDPARMNAVRALLDARKADLSEFRGRGGKIIMYLGWADTALTPYMGIDYYQRAVATMGPRTGDFFRLFMVPGMFHCRGGIGPDRFDALTPLINWIEGGQAPGRIVADQEEGGVVVRTRPHNDAGLRTDATNFVCRDPS